MFFLEKILLSCFPFSLSLSYFLSMPPLPNLPLLPHFAPHSTHSSITFVKCHLLSISPSCFSSTLPPLYFLSPSLLHSPISHSSAFSSLNLHLHQLLPFPPVPTFFPPSASTSSFSSRPSLPPSLTL